MIDQETANQITEYKIRERIIRRKRLNSLLIMLEAQAEQAELETITLPGGELNKAREFYESQIVRIAAFIPLCDQITASYHNLLLQAQAVDQSLFFSEVPPIG
jgi:hypothetical protein